MSNFRLGVSRDLGRKVGLTLLSTSLAVFAAASCYAAETTVRPALNYSKTFGGSGIDEAKSVATDPAGNVYVTGTTRSLDFPVKNAFQPRAGGVPVRSTSDNGKTWILPAIAAPVYAVTASPAAPNVWYAGTAIGMNKSTDAGKNWSPLSFPFALVNALVADPANAAIIYAGTNRGVYKSVDAGVTWKLTDTGRNVLALVSNPARPATLFAAVSESGIPTAPSLYRSIDAGATWSLLSNSPLGPFALACDPANPDVVYLSVSSNGFRSGGVTGIHKSTDSGTTWRRVSDANLSLTTFNLAAGGNVIYAAAKTGLILSRDGGTTWNATSITAVSKDVAVDPNNPQVVYADADGILISTDSGAKWTSVLPIRQNVETLVVLPSTPPTVFVGSEPGVNGFVTKWSADGKTMLYSTYLGGGYFDYPMSVAVDRQGNAYVAGTAYSTDFPITAGAVQSKSSAGYAAFLTKLGPDGALLYSTYLGGSTADAAFAVAVDGAGNAYLTGYARSVDFPVTPGALQSQLRQGCPMISTSPTTSAPVFGDAFVAKIDTVAKTLRFATLLGGTCADEGLGIAVDASGSAYVVGATTSDDFPATKGAFQPGSRGFNQGFLAKLSPQGNALSFATYLGGSDQDCAYGVALDDKGSIYVTGTTAGFDQVLFVPPPEIILSSTTASGFFPTGGFAGGIGGAAYVLKLDPSGSSRTYVKYLGGTWGDGLSIAIDASGRAWVAGGIYSRVSSDEFPMVHPFQAGLGNGFVSEVSADGSAVLFSSLTESAVWLALDATGSVFVAGSTVLDPSASLMRIDSAVTTAVTIEQPRPIVALSASDRQPGIAPGEVITLVGSGLGPAQEVGVQLANGRVSTSVAGVSVIFGGSPAPLLSVQAGKVVCVVPFHFATDLLGATTIQLINGADSSNVIRLPTAAFAAEVLAVTNDDGNVNSPTRPAAPGSIVTLWAAGFGVTEPASLDGQINTAAAVTFRGGRLLVTFDRQESQILYAGPAPGQVAGIVQINLRIPQLATGQYKAAMSLLAGSPGQTVANLGEVSISVGPNVTRQLN